MRRRRVIFSDFVCSRMRRIFSGIAPEVRDRGCLRADESGSRFGALSVPMPDNRRSRVIRRRQLPLAAVARPQQRRIEFFFDHRLVKAAHLRSQACLDEALARDPEGP